MPETTPPTSEAADPSPYEEATRRSTSTSRYAAHGRGGAGNISAAPPRPVSPTDLETPTLKEEVYTTGRGGSGNMVANTGKAGARRAQDVVALPRRESEGAGAHVGRGGAANIVKVPTRGQGEESSVEGRDEKDGREKKEVKEKKELKGKGKNNEGAPAEEGVVERGRRWVAGLVRRGSSS
ncbi:hypothetical protein V499_03752 [Pseudogymnoascus sp. VKM F-103]|uniref:Uncharacterized protein n=1 Tax=Pseudogymnoascus verrucosus TaxID=342668 RepID=A0A1B8GW09_9PEZI|nr:uncharacterized protein VE01_01698 [Pseudogymnoascus verrucosus]KFY76687.1 hypothetical protein V499_03752 [Pseudogymnoascus sp. VKM F-103]OBU00014.1 hypothetical protein VE01_01698 [Pseudogymnoascus verrucosus]